ncbi:MAG: threonine-phosphate decarboxylase [Gammaproteobacteria bacterium]|nr:threonine-phosphate decarboxylase [Gammaproteobacteria bacterium]
MEHGGRLAVAARRYGGAPEEWIDLSTAINPWSYPVPGLAPQIWSRLPEPEQVQQLEEIARTAYGAPDAAQVVAAAGTQALIQMLPRLLPKRRVFVLSPTYGEHALCWRRGGHDVHLCHSLDALSDYSGVLVLTRPNNPDGRVIDSAVLAVLSARLRSSGGVLIIDEAFADTCPEMSLAPESDQAHLVVLRSFGKFFGLAGVRLGFALTGDAGLAARLREHLGPWALSAPAIAIGQQALADSDWITRSRMRLVTMARKTETVVAKAGVRRVGQHPLFILLHCDAPRAAQRLARARILVRTFKDHEQWLRIGCVPDEECLRQLCAIVSEAGAAAPVGSK